MGEEREWVRVGRVLVGAPALAAIAAHSAAAFPEEACGILLGPAPAPDRETVYVGRVRPAQNVASPEDRGRRFEIDPRLVIDTQRELRGTGEAIVGFYHSHPGSEARPSPTDMPFLRLWPRTVWLIVETHGAGAVRPRAWWLEASDAQPIELPIETRDAPPPAG